MQEEKAETRVRAYTCVEGVHLRLEGACEGRNERWRAGTDAKDQAGSQSLAWASSLVGSSVELSGMQAFIMIGMALMKLNKVSLCLTCRGSS
eukprot:3423485-Rhodomonas_salina.4